MRLKSIAALFVIAFAPAVSAAASNSPPPAILKLTSAVIQATNADDASALAGLFTSDAVIVDENPPFVWRGANAGVVWWHVVQRVTQKAHLTGLKATTMRIGEFKQSPADAYLVESMKITATAAGKPFAESGTLTYTFHNAGGTWLISTMVWTTRPGG